MSIESAIEEIKALAEYDRQENEREHHREKIRDEISILKEIYIQLAIADKSELANYVDNKIDILRGELTQ